MLEANSNVNDYKYEEIEWGVEMKPTDCWRLELQPNEMEWCKWNGHDFGLQVQGGNGLFSFKDNARGVTRCNFSARKILTLTLCLSTKIFQNGW